jgi:hypothetical protein
LPVDYRHFSKSSKANTRNPDKTGFPIRSNLPRPKLSIFGGENRQNPHAKSDRTDYRLIDSATSRDEKATYSHPVFDIEQNLKEAVNTTISIGSIG